MFFLLFWDVKIKTEDDAGDEQSFILKLEHHFPFNSIFFAANFSMNEQISEKEFSTGAVTCTSS